MTIHLIRLPFICLLTNSGIIEELSTNFLFVNDASINDLSLINAQDFSFISGLKADISNLDVSNITIKTEFLRIKTISCNDLSVINLDVSTIDCNLGRFTKVETDDIILNDTTLTLNKVNLQYLRCFIYW